MNVRRIVARPLRFAAAKRVLLESRAFSERPTPMSDTSTRGLSYKDAGVDIDAGNALVGRIRDIARRTRRPEVLGGIGGFGALCEIPARYR